MHRFVCFPTADRTLPPDLRGAHLVGNDGVPLRAEIRYEDDEIRCVPRMQDPVGLSLLWHVPDFGSIQLQTTRLPARDKPYHLHVELARHQLMRLTVKREEWGLFDYEGMDDIAARIDRCRDAFVKALQASDDPHQAARHADTALTEGLWAGEEMARFHAGIFLDRRRQSSGFSRPFLGVHVCNRISNTARAKQIAGPFDFAYIPLIWRQIQATEQSIRFDAVDTCVKACAGAKLMLRGGPLLTFGIRSVPDWMYIWENDFESIYDAAREHVERTVKRYAKQISSWVVASGLQADSVFGFSFEQTMELTRMAAAVTKQIAPRSQVLIDICQPWGEYYARNQQTIPPLLYADMAVQSGINFDGFGLHALFGIGSDGYHLRDPFQVSVLIDKLANLGKPLHVTALGIPSESSEGGQWHAPWSDKTQADWLETICEIALSKPYVESVCIHPLADGPDHVITTGGVLREDLSPKPAFQRLVDLRKRLLGGSAK